MIQIRTNELVHPDMIRRAVSGQDEHGATLALTMQAGDVERLTGDDAVNCWAELQARRAAPAAGRRKKGEAAASETATPE
jgi:hypothetical protein